MNGLMDELVLAGGGLFSAQQAAAVGVKPADLRTQLRAGRLVVVYRGWYAAAAERSEVERHRLAAEAARRQHRGRLALDAHSALVHRGIPVLTAGLDRVALTRITTGCNSASTISTISGFVEPANAPDGVVTAALAVVRHGLRAGLRSPVVAGDFALHHELMTLAQVRAAIATIDHQSGAEVTRTLPDWLDAKAESVAESMGRVSLRLCGFSVLSQVGVATRSGTYRLDFLIEGTRVAIEIDGAEKYLTDRKGVVHAVRRHIGRDEDLRLAGYEVVHLTWGELTDLALITRRVNAAIARSRASRTA